MTHTDLHPVDTIHAGGKPSAVDRAVDQIRGFIADNGLVIGDALPTERALGERLQASRNTVREALVVLRAYGLVETRPKVGAVVSGGHAEAVRRLFSFHSGISPDAFRDMQGFRKMVEVEVGKQVLATATDAHFDDLNHINDRILAVRGPREAALADYAFHEGIIALGGNRTTLATYRMLRPVMLDVMEVGKASRPVQHDTHAAHAEIVAAMRARDAIAYAYLLARHLDFGLRFFESAETDCTFMGPSNQPKGAKDGV